MNMTTRLQVIAGVASVIALPVIYFGLRAGGTSAPVYGLALFFCAMTITPLLRVLPTDFSSGEE
jgi:hypothetical protein